MLLTTPNGVSSSSVKAFRELSIQAKCGVGFALAGFFVAITLAAFAVYWTSQPLPRNELLFLEFLSFCLCPTIGFAIALGNVGVENPLVKVLFVAGTNGAFYGTIGFACGLLWERTKRTLAKRSRSPRRN
jgi:hypothetical protein